MARDTSRRFLFMKKDTDYTVSLPPIINSKVESMNVQASAPNSHLEETTYSNIDRFVPGVHLKAIK